MAKCKGCECDEVFVLDNPTYDFNDDGLCALCAAGAEIEQLRECVIEARAWAKSDLNRCNAVASPTLHVRIKPCNAALKQETTKETSLET